MQGSEARDALLAQIFGCAALVRTGRVQDWAAADAMTTMLLSAGGKKAFLREVAAEVLLEMLGESYGSCCLPSHTAAEAAAVFNGCVDRASAFEI